MLRRVYILCWVASQVRFNVKEKVYSSGGHRRTRPVELTRPADQSLDGDLNYDGRPPTRVEYLAMLSRELVAFPTFGDEQLEKVGAIADLVSFKPEEELISQGQKDYPFYVIKSGRVRIVERDLDRERLITTHETGNFTGDVDMLTRRSSMIAAIASSDVTAYRMCGQRLRKLLNECPDASATLLDAFQIRRKMLAETDFIGVRMIGRRNASETNRLREFFYKNHVPHTFFDADQQSGQHELEALDAGSLPLPVVRCNGHTVGDPSLPKLAECIGISRDVDQQFFDLIIVGAGPAGLAAAVYASSEGLSTLVIDSVGPGGQAGSSSKIENFIGFPSGLSGSELANLGYLQALKFGTQFIAPITVRSIETSGSGEHHLKLCTGQTARTRCVLVASGVTYRQLALPGCERLRGAGVYSAATTVEAKVCQDETAIVVGGGNSAGQAAMFLAEHAREVKLLIRGGDLSKSMSAYLCDRVLKHPNIELMRHTEVDAINGDPHLESVCIRNNQHGATEMLDCTALFTFIGAKPHTDWLPKDVLLDEKGFVLTGSSFYSHEHLRSRWPLDRAPCDLETTVPGIMAAGDARAGTTKRCGFAVGDGSLAVSCVHRYLNDL